jgi:hypothetical protein
MNGKANSRGTGLRSTLMCTSTISRVSHGARTGGGRLAAALAVLAVALLAAGCDASTTSVGQRCVPTVNDPPNPVNVVNPNPSGVSISHDFCDNGLSCFNPPDCAEYYCCPTTDPTSSPNGYCQAGCQGGALFILISGCNASGWAAPPGWPGTLVGGNPPPGWSPDFCNCFLFGATYGATIGGPVSSTGICACAGVQDPIACLAATANDGGTEGGTSDAGSPDTGSSEAGSPDAETPDTGSPDAGTPDTGTSEGGPTDAGGE